MSKKTFIVTKPNLMLKQSANGVKKLVKVDVGTEYTCEEKDVINHVKSGRLVVAKAAKKLESK